MIAERRSCLRRDAADFERGGVFLMPSTALSEAARVANVFHEGRFSMDVLVDVKGLGAAADGE